MVNQYSVSEIAAAAEMPFELRGDISRMVSGVNLPHEATATELGWIKPGHPTAAENLRTTRAGALFVQSGTVAETNATLILVENPRLAFLRAVSKLFARKPEPGIHPLASVHTEAKIGEGVYIGPFAVVGRCSIGAHSVIHGHVYLYDGVEIGSHVTIHAGTVVGADGYGYSRNERGELEKFPHVGKVVIENHVEIGTNTSIDRGTLGETRLCEGCKIDNLVHIAHNVRVGRHAAVIANAMIGGSTSIGDEAWIAPSAALMNGIQIGEKTTVGMGAVVTKSIPDGETWTGVPARPLKEFVDIQKKLKSL